MPLLHLYTGGYLGRVETLVFDSEKETLTKLSEIGTGGNAPTWLTLSPDGTTMYAKDEWADKEGSITCYAIDPSSHKLTHKSHIKSKGLWPCHSTILGSDPPRLITANYYDAVVHSFPLTADCHDFDHEQKIAKEEIFNLKGTDRTGPHPDRQQQEHPHAVTVDPTGKFVVVPDLGTDSLRLFAVQESGKLQPARNLRLTPSSGPRHCLFDVNETNGRTFLYALNELGNSITMMKIEYTADKSLPDITPAQMDVSILPPAPVGTQSDFPVWHAAELAIHVDQSTGTKRLYASNRAEAHAPLKGTKKGEADVFAVFEIDVDSGKLREETKKIQTSFVRAPRHFSFSSDSIERRGKDSGEFMAIAGHDSDEIVIARVEKDGSLRKICQLDDAGRPGCVLWA